MENKKLITVTYNGLEFTVDFTKRGVPDIYHDGKLLKPTFNQYVKRWYVHAYLGSEWSKTPGATPHCQRKNLGYYNVPRYRIVCAALVKMRTGEFNYEEYRHMECDHIDGDSTNDNPSNIRFTTRKRNNSRKMARERKSMNHAHVQHTHEIVRARKDGEELLFKNVHQCAKELGFSHVLGYRVINRTDYAQKARGWVLDYVPMDYGIFNKEDLNND